MRENLLQEINNTFLQWPALDRRIFSQAHYHGQSPEAISRSIQVDIKEVRVILRRCERRLYDSLRNFRKNSADEAPLIPAGISHLSSYEQDLGIRALAS